MKKNKLHIIFILVVLLAVCAVLTIYIVSEYMSLPLEYTEYAEKYSREYDIPLPLLYAVIKTESGFKPDATSHAGACGLMQLMPMTYEEIAERLGEQPDITRIYEPEQNIRYGTLYLAYLYRDFGDWYTALAAYNAGIGRVSGWLDDRRYSSDGSSLQEIPVSETKNYVEKIKKLEKKYSDLLEEETK